MPAFEIWRRRIISVVMYVQLVLYVLGPFSDTFWMCTFTFSGRILDMQGIAGVTFGRSDSEGSGMVVLCPVGTFVWRIGFMALYDCLCGFEHYCGDL